MKPADFPLFIANSITALKALTQQGPSQRESLAFESGEAFARYKAAYDTLRKAILDLEESRNSRKALPEGDAPVREIERIADRMCVLADQMCDLGDLVGVTLDYCQVLHSTIELLEIEIRKLEKG